AGAGLGALRDRAALAGAGLWRVVGGDALVEAASLRPRGESSPAGDPATARSGRLPPALRTGRRRTSVRGVPRPIPPRAARQRVARGGRRLQGRFADGKADDLLAPGGGRQEIRFPPDAAD